MLNTEETVQAVNHFLTVAAEMLDFPEGVKAGSPAAKERLQKAYQAMQPLREAVPNTGDVQGVLDMANRISRVCWENGTTVQELSSPDRVP